MDSGENFRTSEAQTSLLAAAAASHPASLHIDFRRPASCNHNYRISIKMEKQQQEVKHEEEQNKQVVVGKTFVFLPIDAHGHVNAMIGLADQLKMLNHRTVFVCNDNQAPKYFGHELILVSEWRKSKSPEKLSQLERSELEGGEESVFVKNDKLNNKWAQMVDLLNLNVNKQELVEQSLTENYKLLRLTIEAEILPMDATVEEIIVHLKPDLALVDQLCPIPAVHRLASDEQYARERGLDQPLRWLCLATCNPLGLFHAFSPDRFPPPLMGLPVEQRPAAADWLREQQLRYQCVLLSSGMLEIVGKMFQLTRTNNATHSDHSNDDLARFARNESQWLNVYMFPHRLDYAATATAALPANWLQVDSLIRRALPGKRSDQRLVEQVRRWRQMSSAARIIYVSLGTTMSCNLELLGALLGQLMLCVSRQPDWRFAVALGSRADRLPAAQLAQLEKWQSQGRLLSSVWWPQPELFSQGLLDACVTHGGNNTLCELLHFQVPHLVLISGFHDQLDNARRVDELGLGVALGASQLIESGPNGQLLVDAMEKSLSSTSTSASGDRAATGWQLRDALYCARMIEAKLCDC